MVNQQLTNEGLTALFGIMPDSCAHIEAVFISDLHLDPTKPALMQAFLALLDELLALSQLQQLFILGDWFEAWLGDDLAQSPPLQAWLEPMLERLRQLTTSGCQILVMGGNRDFLLGQGFCQRFGGIKITEPYFFNLGKTRLRLEHGDQLCSDDVSYQRFRRVIQHPLTKRLLLSLPKGQRERLAKRLRQTSRQANQQKSMQVMDVNPQAVAHAMQGVEVLVHGHTHRPAYHPLADGKTRLVLGDWRIIKHDARQQVNAVIGISTREKLQLVDWQVAIDCLRR